MALSSLQMLEIHAWLQSQCCFLQDAINETCKDDAFWNHCVLHFNEFFYWNVSENGDMKTPQTPPPWRHWRKHWSHWINLKYKQVDINVLESWIFQCGGFFLMMSKCNILGFWFLFFQNSFMKSQYFTVMKIHFSDGVLHSDSCITGWIDMDLHCFRKSAAKVF